MKSSSCETPPKPVPSLGLGIMGLTWVEKVGKDRTLEKIVRATCEAHKWKLGCLPNVILVHLDLVAEKTQLCGVTLIPHRGILLHHYHAIHIGDK